ncbi:hypothetical protein ACV3UL_04030 [Clostridium perfringens]
MRDDYIDLAKSVDILDILKYIENDLGVNFNIQSGSTTNLICPHLIFDREESVHESDNVMKTSINLAKNTIKCWNPACIVNKGLDTIGLIKMFYECSFQSAVKKVLDIGGFEYSFEEKEVSEETQVAILLTRYVNECCENLIKGFEFIEEGKQPRGRVDNLIFDAASYLLSRGISKDVAKKMRLGVGGTQVKTLKNTDKNLLVKSKILGGKKYFEIMSRRIIIPNISKGLVIGMTGRDIYDGERRYLNVGAVKNLINIDNAKKHSRIYLFEGALNGASYMALTGKDNFMAMQGAESFKREFLKEVIKEHVGFSNTTEFIYVSDYDTAGLKAATDLGLEFLRLGLSLNVLVTPQDSTGKKIDTNDIIKIYGLEKGKKVWNEFIKTAEPFIIFVIKQEIAQLDKLNTITYEIQKCKIIEKYLKLDFVNPLERWVLEQYFLKHNYPTTKEFFKYTDLHFSKEPKLSDNKLICFVGEVNKELEENLIENNRPYNILDIDVKVNIYDIDSSVEVILITDSLFLLKTKKIYEKLIEIGCSVKIFHTDKQIKSLLEYTFAINKAVNGEIFFNEIGKK